VRRQVGVGRGVVARSQRPSEVTDLRGNMKPIR